MNILQEHSAMVTRLAKSGKDILSTMTPVDEHLHHMLIGMVGELAELQLGMQAWNLDNCLEELGDFEFYFRGYCQVFNFEPVVASGAPCMQSPWMDLYQAVDALVDQTKRRTIYRKQLEDVEFIEIFQAIGSALGNVYSFLAIKRQDALNHNLNKLLKGDRARYAEGSYSDTQANARADKQGD